MSRVVTRSSVRTENMKAEFNSNLTGVFAISGFLLSMYALWSDDLTRITNVDYTAAAAGVACLLIAGYRFGIIRR